MKPDPIERVFGRSRLRMVTGDHVEVFREAVAAHEKMAGIDPTWRWGLAHTLALAGRIAEARKIAKDLERAYYTYLKAQEAHPEDVTAYRRLSDICRRTGRADEAKAWSVRWTEVNRKRFVHRN